MTTNNERESNPQALFKSMEEYAQLLRSDPKRAMRFLVDAGILTPDGELHKNFGGDAE